MDNGMMTSGEPSSYAYDPYYDDPYYNPYGGHHDMGSGTMSSGAAPHYDPYYDPYYPYGGGHHDMGSGAMG